MLQLIVFIIFIVSLGGVFFMLYKKAPVLVQLPRNGHHGLKSPEFISKITKKIKEHHFRFFEKQMLLHKLLSWVRVRTLKVERKVDGVLQGIRKKAQELDKEIEKKK